MRDDDRPDSDPDEATVSGQAGDGPAAPGPAEVAWSVIEAGARDPVVVILFFAGFFDAISGNLIDAPLLLGVAVALAWKDAPSSAVRTGPSGNEGSLWTAFGSAASPLVIALTAMSFGIAAGAFQRESWWMTAAILVPGVLALAAAWHVEPAGPRRSGAVTGFAPWAALFVMLGLWELTNLLLQPSLTTDSWDHPTLSVLTDPLITAQPGRSIGLALWLAFGMWLARR